MKSLNEAAAQMLATSTNGVVDQELDHLDDEYMALKMALPKGVDIKQAIEYGFYEHKHRYWMRRGGDMRFEAISNFTMKVLYLIEGANPKRIVEIRNVYGITRTIDMAIEDMISLDKFRVRVESLGNFIFEGKATDLTRIKTQLLNNERSAIEIARLGQYKNHFWAWANGIYTGAAWIPTDDRGMVEVDGQHYFIPVMSNTAADNDEDLRNYRKFLHREGPVAFKQWGDLFCKVYGENGRMGLAFLLFSLFSDIIFDRTKAAPMLFLFGQRGSGKGTMANSLLNLYGHPQDPLMLGGASTVVGFMRKLGQFSNAITWLDEYKNDIGEKKIESLKNIWDRVGYERGVKDSSNKTQTTPITSSAIISGQEIPNVEPALFSRCVLCVFRAMERTQEEVNAFDALRAMEDKGITNATLEVTQYREHMKQHWHTNYTEIAKTLRAAFGGMDIIERQIINYAILVSTVQTLQEKMPMPFHWTELLKQSERYILRQRDMMSNSNEVQQFFEMIGFLISSKTIVHGVDFHVSQGAVKIRTITIFPHYREHSRRQGLKPLERGTLMDYLKNSPAYIESDSKTGSHRFPGLQNPTSCQVFLQHEISKHYGVDFREFLESAENQQVQEQTPQNTPF